MTDVLGYQLWAQQKRSDLCLPTFVAHSFFLSFCRGNALNQNISSLGFRARCDFEKGQTPWFGIPPRTKKMWSLIRENLETSTCLCFFEGKKRCDWNQQSRNAGICHFIPRFFSVLLQNWEELCMDQYQFRGKLRRTFRTIGPYEFPQEKVWTNDWSIWISPGICMNQWRSKFSESFSLDRYWSIECSSLQNLRQNLWFSSTCDLKMQRFAITILWGAKIFRKPQQNALQGPLFTARLLRQLSAEEWLI